MRAPGDFTALLAIGVVLALGVQALVIGGGLLGLIPLTGVVTPFLSYGRSSMLANCFAIGVVLAVARRRGPVRMHLRRRCVRSRRRCSVAASRSRRAPLGAGRASRRIRHGREPDRTGATAAIGSSTTRAWWRAQRDLSAARSRPQRPAARDEPRRPKSRALNAVYREGRHLCPSRTAPDDGRAVLSARRAGLQLLGDWNTQVELGRAQLVVRRARQRHACSRATTIGSGPRRGRQPADRRARSHGVRRDLS